MNTIIKRANYELKDKIAAATLERRTRLNVINGEDRMFDKCTEFKSDSLDYIKGTGYEVRIWNNRDEYRYLAALDENQNVILIER